MEPDYKNAFRDADGGEHTLSFYCDPHERGHVAMYEFKGNGRPWSASKVAEEIKREAGVEPRNVRLYDSRPDQSVGRYDFNQGHLSSVNPDGRAVEAPERLSSSKSEFQRDVDRIQDQRLDQAKGPNIDRDDERRQRRGDIKR